MKCIKCNNDITNHKEINGKNYCINCSIKKYKKIYVMEDVKWIKK